MNGDSLYWFIPNNKLKCSIGGKRYQLEKYKPLQATSDACRVLREGGYGFSEKECPLCGEQLKPDKTINHFLSHFDIPTPKEPPRDNFIKKVKSLICPNCGLVAHDKQELETHMVLHIQGDSDWWK